MRHTPRRLGRQRWPEVELLVKSAKVQQETFISVSHSRLKRSPAIPQTIATTATTTTATAATATHLGEHNSLGTHAVLVSHGVQALQQRKHLRRATQGRGTGPTGTATGPSSSCSFSPRLLYTGPHVRTLRASATTRWHFRGSTTNSGGTAAGARQCMQSKERWEESVGCGSDREGPGCRCTQGGSIHVAHEQPIPSSPPPPPPSYNVNVFALSLCGGIGRALTCTWLKPRTLSYCAACMHFHHACSHGIPVVGGAAAGCVASSSLSLSPLPFRVLFTARPLVVRRTICLSKHGAT